MGGEIGRYEIDALGHLTADERLRVLDTACIGNHLHIGRGITHTDKLTTHLTMRLVDHDNRYLVDYLIIVDPRIKQRIDNGHDDAEDQHALILKDLLQLLTPDESSILYCTV